jgi:hypothetical protein
MKLHCTHASAIALCALATPSFAGDDPFADEVITYEEGVDFNPAYVTPASTLGSPERYTGEGVFPSVVSPFSPPWGTDEILSIGKGGALVVRFDAPVMDDPGNPFGIDLLVFGNTGFIDAEWPLGVVGGLFGADGGSIEVSADGENWELIEGISADAMFPPLGYLDAGPYDETAGSVESDFTLPVDPALTMDDFISLMHEEVVALYDGSGGGAGIDLAAVGLRAISYVRITNPADAIEAIEIDAFADVAATGQPGDVDGDGDVDFSDLLALLSAWGPCGGCPADFDGDGVVAFSDLLILLASWG